jgi:5-methylcytosine-specific restriction endonuclease McrA
MADAWAALGRRRRTLAIQVYQRDSTTHGYTCPGTPTKPCGLPIDWDLPYRDPYTGQVNTMSKTVDHAIELQDGGPILDLDNCWSAHLACNSSKGSARRHQREREARQQHTTTAIIVVDLHTL